MDEKNALLEEEEEVRSAIRGLKDAADVGRIAASLHQEFGDFSSLLSPTHRYTVAGMILNACGGGGGGDDTAVSALKKHMFTNRKALGFDLNLPVFVTEHEKAFVPAVLNLLCEDEQQVWDRDLVELMFSTVLDECTSAVLNAPLNGDYHFMISLYHAFMDSHATDAFVHKVLAVAGTGKLDLRRIPNKKTLFLSSSLQKSGDRLSSLLDVAEKTRREHIHAITMPRPTDPKVKVIPCTVLDNPEYLDVFFFHQEEEEEGSVTHCFRIVGAFVLLILFLMAFRSTATLLYYLSERH